MKPKSRLRLLSVLYSATVLVPCLAHGGGTLVTNNTGIAPTEFTFLDDNFSVLVSGGVGGTDPDTVAFGNSSRWGSIVSANYPFTGLLPNQTYNIYGTWHFGGSGVGMTVKVGTTTIATVSQNTGGAPVIGSGFTAYDDINDASPIETRNFQLLGQASTDGSGNLTVNASTTPGSSFMRWDCFAVAPAPPTVPDVVHWDGNQSTVNDASDNSSTSPLNWLSGGNWDDGTTSAPITIWSPGDSAVFGGTMSGSQTISLTGSPSIADITFNTAGYVITGGSIVGSETLTITTNADARMNSTIGVAGGTLIKSGNGTLTLGSTTGSHATLSISSGKLSIQTGNYNGLLFTVPITLGNGAILSADNSTNNAHNIGPITLNGATLTSLNEAAGPANDGGFGNWVIRGVTAGGSVPSAITASTIIVNLGSFNVPDITGSPATDLLVSSTILSGSVTKTGAGTMEITAASPTTGNTTISEGTLMLSGSGSLANSPTITVAAGATLDASTANLTIGSSKSLTGAGTVLGTVTVDNGTITPTAGTLSIESLSVSNSAAINILPGVSLLDVTGIDALDPGTGNTVFIDVGTAPLAAGSYPIVKFNGNIQGDGIGSFQVGFNPGGSYTYELAEISGHINLVVIPTADLWTGASGSEWSTANLLPAGNWKTGTTPKNYANGNEVIFDDSAISTLINISPADVSPSSVTFGNNSKNFTLQGPNEIEGSTEVVKSGQGTLTINNLNSFTGNVTVTGGTLAFATVANAGVNSSIGAGNSVMLDGGTLSYFGANASSDRSLALDSPSALEISSAATLTLTGEVSGTALTKMGPGTVALVFDNIYSGPTRIEGGTMSVDWIADGGIASPLGQSPAAAANLILAGGSLQYTGTGTTSNRGFSLLASTSSSIEVTDPDATLTLTGGTPASSAALTKLGTGKLTLGGNTNHSGPTTVAAGTLEIVAGFNASSPIHIASDAILDGKSVGLSLGNLTGQGTLIHSAGNGFKLFGDNSAFAGTFIQTAGIGYLGNSTASGSELATWTINAGDLLLGDNFAPGYIAKLGALSGSGGFIEPAWNGTGTTTLEVGALGTDTTCATILRDRFPDSGSIQNLALTKVGTGTLTLAGLNSYTGNTTVNGGTLILADDASIRFKIGSTSATNNQLTGTASVLLNGDFAIDTTAASALETGTWLLENIPSLGGAYGESFTVTDPDGTPWNDSGSNQWTKSAGPDIRWTFDETTGTLTLGPAAGDFESWAIENDVTGGESGDSDNDGIANLIEYALDLNPAASDGSPGTFHAPTRVLSFAKRPEAVENNDITYIIEESDDLGADDPWTEVPSYTTNDSTTISYTLPNGKNATFARLVVQKTNP